MLHAWATATVSCQLADYVLSRFTCPTSVCSFEQNCPLWSSCGRQGCEPPFFRIPPPLAGEVSSVGPTPVTGGIVPGGHWRAGHLEPPLAASERATSAMRDVFLRSTYLGRQTDQGTGDDRRGGGSKIFARAQAEARQIEHRPSPPPNSGGGVGPSHAHRPGRCCAEVSPRLPARSPRRPLTHPESHPLPLDPYSNSMITCRTTPQIFTWRPARLRTG